MCMGKTPVLLCTEAWFVHVCVAAQTNGALAHQNQNLHQNLLLQQWGSLCWLCKKKPKPKPKTKKMKKKISSARRHRRRASGKRRPAFPCGHPALYKNFQHALLQMLRRECGSQRDGWAQRVRRLPGQHSCRGSLRACVLTARTWVLPVFFKEGSPPRSALRFPFSPKGLFGSAMDGFVERFSEAQKTLQALCHFLPKCSNSSDCQSPVSPHHSACEASAASAPAKNWAWASVAPPDSKAVSIPEAPRSPPSSSIGPWAPEAVLIQQRGRGGDQFSPRPELPQRQFALNHPFEHLWEMEFCFQRVMSCRRSAYLNVLPLW